VSRHPRAILDRIGETGEFEQALLPARQFIPAKVRCFLQALEAQTRIALAAAGAQTGKPCDSWYCENAVADDAPAR
jgi:hypothetical protein